MYRIAIVGNAPQTLIGFRLDLIKDLVSKGHKVFAFSPDYNKEQKEIIESAGAVPVSFKMSRSGLNPLSELSVIWELKKILSYNKIEVTLAYFIKPVIYGSIAAKLAGLKNINSMIAGLGYAFTDIEEEKFNVKRNFVKSVLNQLFKVALKFNRKVFFQNPDDLEVFVINGLVNSEKAVRVYGSGVNLNEFEEVKPKSSPVTFLTMGRLLIEKGFREYYQAAKLIKQKYPDTQFILLGGHDENPSSLQHSEIENWSKDGVIDWPGKVSNVKEWLHRSSVFVLPSYREGTPRSTLEAMAIGRAVISTNVPGCRETVEEGENGYLVPPKDPQKLAEAMERFILRPELIEKMGHESRKLAEEKYDVRKVNEFMIKEMGLQMI